MADNIPVIVPVSSTSMATEEMVDNTNALALVSSGYRALNDVGGNPLPNTEYQLERVKIAVGPYDKDAGDVLPTNPLPVGTLQERRSLEYAEVNGMNQVSLGMQTRGKERVSMVDRRGGFGQRGVRF